MSSTVPARETGAVGEPPHARKSVIIAKNIVHNWRSKFRQALGEMSSAIGATHAGRPVEESLEYIDRVYRDYVDYGGLTPDRIEGRRILEIGPGDNFGVALHFLADGAAAVVGLDKFATSRDNDHAAAIYRAMRARLAGRAAERFDAAAALRGGIRFDPERLHSIEGVGTEEAHRVLESESFSLIVSRAVLEEIYPIDRAFEAMDRLLEPGGLMLHKIDLSDYGMFSDHGMHPLEFLTIPEPVYHMMTEHSGQPNRRRIDYYRTKMRELGYFAGLLVTAIAGVPGEVVPHKPSIEAGVDYSDASLALVREIRPRLARRFRHLSDDDLLVTGIFLVARKPE